MDLPASSWHVRFYHFCRLVWMNFSNGLDTNDYVSPNTDLCSYIRTIFVLFPLSIVVNLAFWAWVIWALVIFPSNALGIMDYVLLLGSVALFIAASYFGCRLYIKHRKAKAEALYEERRRQRRLGIEPEEPAPGLAYLMFQRVKSLHERICVTIKIKG